MLKNNGDSFLFSGLPQLAVSSSTPPPSSPLPLTIKSEPISPPRDSSLSQHGPHGTHGPHGSLLHTNLNPHAMHAHHHLPRPNSAGHLTPTSGNYLLNYFLKKNVMIFFQAQLRRLISHRRAIPGIAAGPNTIVVRLIKGRGCLINGLHSIQTAVTEADTRALFIKYPDFENAHEP